MLYSLYFAFSVLECPLLRLQLSTYSFMLRLIGTYNLFPYLPSLATVQSGAGLLHGFVERPKQRRHRCKDPTKLDINSLTGEERVPVVHRGTGRRVENTHRHAYKIHETQKSNKSVHFKT